MPKKRNPRKINKKRHQKRAKRNHLRRWILFAVLLVAMVGTGFYLKNKLTFYYALLWGKSHKTLTNSVYETQRINAIMVEHQGKIFGMDISHYQRKEDIVWDSLSIVNGDIPLDFVVLRATMGNAAKDRHFNEFWQQSKKHGYTRGAYHFYRPDEDPVYQANNFLASVRLEKGDLRPILDLEKVPKRKPRKKYIEDIKVWLKIVEKAYGTKPIIYTYYHFYKDYLKGHFSTYPLWLANYNPVLKPSPIDDWHFWQFTEQGIVKGVDVKVDLDVFNGEARDFQKMKLD
ncbi:GH25 family lysozyme [Riemerella columbina]|uniref:GH25 family lysozyme n=1 Tax=Riemerella columbina TaxID=103810 RepID=UPI00266ED94D|nr:GH25 family lysozyme [Riemerella columbina]WKS94419.1 glycoside hydrolase family 25 protein [Riemerella columbina]